MATRIDALPEGHARVRGQSKYPLDDWLDGSAWLLRQGEDFTCGFDGIRSLLVYHARVRGKTITLREDRRAGTMAIQASEAAGSR